jgi:hypothetical protein
MVLALRAGKISNQDESREKSKVQGSKAEVGTYVLFFDDS